MAANLDYKEDGTAAVVSIGETPWHREGSIKLDRSYPTTIELSKNLDGVLELAGLNFEVRKFPTFFHPGGADGITLDPGAWRRAKGGNAIIRMDRMTAIGSVGNDYTPLQNKDAFEPARQLLERGLGTIETAGALDGGSDVWLLVRLVPSAIMAAAEESVARLIAAKGMDAQLASSIGALESYLGEVLPFAHFSTHHGGKRAAIVQETGVRVVCANTQAMALDGEAEGIRIRVRHDQGVKDTYAEAVGSMMNGLALRYMSLANARVILQGVRLTTEQFERLVLETAVPVHHLETKLRNRDGNGHTRSALEKAHEKRGEIERLWTMGKGHTGDRSAWEAYQGLIEYTDHSTLSLKTGSNRLASLQTGTLGNVKGRVYSDLVMHASGEPLA